MRRYALILLVSLCCGEVASAQRPLDARLFAAEIRRLAHRIETATPAEAVEIDKTVPAVWSVEQGIQRFDVPAGWLGSALRDESRHSATWPAARAEIVGRLVAIARESEALAGAGPGQGLDAAQAALTNVLANREFAARRRENALQRMWDTIAGWISDVLRRLGLGRVVRAATAEVIAWVVSLLALAALLFWLIRALRKTPGPVPLPKGSGVAEQVTARAWAQRALAAGDAREAVRCAYRAAMCRLEEEGVWRLDEARTPREYVHLLPVHHRRRGTVAAIARQFEEIWYGARNATDDDRRAAVGRLKELECLPAD